MWRVVGCLGVALLATAITGCSRDDDGIDDRSAVDPGIELVERCLLFASDQDEQVTELPFVESCDEPHTHEIYWAGLYQTPPEDATATTTSIDERATEALVYPGQQLLERFAERKCAAEFFGYVGSEVVDSELFYSWMIPTLDGWNDADDRTIICVVGRPSAPGETFEGSVKGSGL